VAASLPTPAGLSADTGKAGRKAATPWGVVLDRPARAGSHL